MEEPVATNHKDESPSLSERASMKTETLVYRLRKRAEIRKGIATRKSVQEGKPDRIADILEEAADEIERLHKYEAEVLMKPYNQEQHG